MLRKLGPVVFLGVFLGVAPSLAIPAAAAPSFEVTASTPTVEKGHNFTILVHVSVEEPLDHLTVTGIAPDGFCLEVLKMPGVTDVRSLHPLDNSKSSDAPVRECAGLPNIVELGPLGRSSFVVPFHVTPPDLSGQPRTGEKGSLYSTREQKEFAFDMIWTAKSGEERVQGNSAVSVRRSIALAAHHSRAWLRRSPHPGAGHATDIELAPGTGPGDRPRHRRRRKADLETSRLRFPPHRTAGVGQPG